MCRAVGSTADEPGVVTAEYERGGLRVGSRVELSADGVLRVTEWMTVRVFTDEAGRVLCREVA